jgi:hypothetical protein
MDGNDAKNAFGVRDGDDFETWYAREVEPSPSAWGLRLVRFVVLVGEQNAGAEAPPGVLADIAKNLDQAAQHAEPLLSGLAAGFKVVALERAQGVADIQKRIASKTRVRGPSGRHPA